MLIETLVIFWLAAFGIWIAATRFVRSRGYPGWYLSYIGAGSKNPTWGSLAEIRQSGDAHDQTRAVFYRNAILASYVGFFVAFLMLMHSYLGG